MPTRVDKKIASRAIDAWMRRVALQRGRRRLGTRVGLPDPQVEQVRREAREALVEAVVDAGLGDNVMSDVACGRKVLSRHLREECSDRVEGVIERLEETVRRKPKSRHRIWPLLEGTRNLLDPRSRATALLVQEITLVMMLSKQRAIPWARRR